jgi:hypothetical protein
MFIKHHKEKFKNDSLVLNNIGYIECEFNNCRLYLVDEPKDILLFVDCKFKDCELVGDGWNYGFVEAWNKHITTNEPLEWQGPIGNRNVTKH